MAKKKVKLGQPDYQIIYDWSGGMNDVINPALLNDNESPRLENVSLDEKGTLYPAKGRTERYNAPFSDKSVNGLGAFYKSDGTSRLVIGADNELYTDSPHHINRFDSQSELEGGAKQNVEIKDGKVEPAQLPLPTFIRSSVAYKSDGSQVATGRPRFEAGKFGQAVLVEEGTTNLLGKTIEELPTWGNRFGLYNENSTVNETRQLDETLQIDEATQYVGEILFNTVLGVIHLI